MHPDYVGEVAPGTVLTGSRSALTLQRSLSALVQPPHDHEVLGGGADHKRVPRVAEGHGSNWLKVSS